MFSKLVFFLAFFLTSCSSTSNNKSQKTLLIKTTKKSPLTKPLPETFACDNFLFVSETNQFLNEKPYDESNILTTLKYGMKVCLEKNENEWSLVSLQSPSFLKGWIKTNSISINISDFSSAMSSSKEALAKGLPYKALIWAKKSNEIQNDEVSLAWMNNVISFINKKNIDVHAEQSSVKDSGLFLVVNSKLWNEIGCDEVLSKKEEDIFNSKNKAKIQVKESEAEENWLSFKGYKEINYNGYFNAKEFSNEELKIFACSKVGQRSNDSDYEGDFGVESMMELARRLSNSQHYNKAISIMTEIQKNYSQYSFSLGPDVGQNYGVLTKNEILRLNCLKNKNKKFFSDKSFIKALKFAVKSNKFEATEQLYSCTPGIYYSQGWHGGEPYSETWTFSEATKYILKHRENIIAIDPKITQEKNKIMIDYPTIIFFLENNELVGIGN